MYTNRGPDDEIEPSLVTSEEMERRNVPPTVPAMSYVTHANDIHDEIAAQRNYDAETMHEGYMEGFTNVPYNNGSNAVGHNITSIWEGTYSTPPDEMQSQARVGRFDNTNNYAMHQYYLSMTSNDRRPTFNVDENYAHPPLSVNTENSSNMDAPTTYSNLQRGVNLARRPLYNQHSHELSLSMYSETMPSQSQGAHQQFRCSHSNGTDSVQVMNSQMPNHASGFVRRPAVVSREYMTQQTPGINNLVPIRQRAVYQRASCSQNLEAYSEVVSQNPDYSSGFGMSEDLAVRRSVDQLSDECSVSQCNSMRKLHTHLETCHEDESCKYMYCSSKKVMKYHWERCSSLGKRVMQADDELNLMPRLRGTKRNYAGQKMLSSGGFDRWHASGPKKEVPSVAVEASTSTVTALDCKPSTSNTDVQSSGMCMKEEETSSEARNSAGQTMLSSGGFDIWHASEPKKEVPSVAVEASTSTVTALDCKPSTSNTDVQSSGMCMKEEENSSETRNSAGQTMLSSGGFDIWHASEPKKEVPSVAVEASTSTVTALDCKPSTSNTGVQWCGMCMKEEENSSQMEWFSEFADRRDEILSNMWKVLECKICLDILVPPVFMCSEGHQVCQSCKARNTKCPLCKKPIMETRMHFLESLIQKLPMPCPNREHGCRNVYCLADRNNHVLLCRYKP